MWQHNYEPIGGSLGLSALAAAIPIFVLFVMLGVLRKPAWHGGTDRACVRAARCARGVRHALPDGDRVDALRRRVRDFSDRVDRLQLDHALPSGRRHRQIRDHQGLSWRLDQRSPAAGDVHRVLFRRVHRRRGRIRCASRGLRRDARRSRILAVLRRRNLSPCQYGASRVRVDRHSDYDARQRDGHPIDAAERDDRQALRDDLSHHSGVSRRRDGRAEARARGVAGDSDLRPLLCRHAVLCLELHRARTDRHPQLAGLHLRRWCWC